MPSDLTRQARKCVNEFLEQSDGNWEMAHDACIEWIASVVDGDAIVDADTAWSFGQFCHELDMAFEEMWPKK